MKTSRTNTSHHFQSSNNIRSRAIRFPSLRVVSVFCAVMVFAGFGVSSAWSGGFDWLSIRTASAESKGAKATAGTSAQRVLAPQTVFFSEGFDGAWTIPSTLLTNASPWSGPFDGTDTDTEWHRNDFQGGWTGLSGAYSPSGNPGFSARFHTFNASSPKVGDLITPVIDLSVNAGSKVLTFNYINPSGTDKVDVAVSTDGGTIYGASVLTTGVSTVWSQQTINLGAVVSSTVTIRFRATSDFGNDDIGIDNVVIGLASAPLAGTKTIKTAGGDYATFTAAINDLNVSGVGAGGVTFNVDAGLTSTEDTPCITAQGTVTDQIIFQKSGAVANPVVRPTGAGGTADFGLCISGGDFITFDGIDVSIATGSAVEYGYLVRNISATNGAQNNTIKNTSITLNRANTSSIGILQSTAATGGGIAATNLTGSNSTNKYYNLTIQNVYAGIYLLGTAAFPDDASEVGVTGAVTKNTIGGAAAGDIGTTSSANAIWGIRAASQSNAKIFNNEIRNATSASTGTVAGIHMDNAGTATAVSLGTTQIYNNQIHDLNATSATAGVVYGIRANLTGNAGSVSRIQNNFIYGQNSSSTATTRRIVGIFVQDAGVGTGATHNVHNNSVRMAPTNLATTNTCFEINGTAATNPVYNIRNNIFSNFTGAQAGAAKHYTWVSSATGSFGTGAVSDFNDLYIDNTTNGFVGLGNATDYATLANWQGMNGATAGPDDTSISANPAYSAATDLHLIGTSPAINTGTTIATVTDDIDAQARPQGPAYDIGADEFVPAPGILQLSSTTYGGSEGGTANATVNRVSGSSGIVGVTYTLTDGSAVGGAACTAGVDYINPGPQLLSFGDTVTSQPIVVTLCSDGAVIDPVETFTITLSLPTGGASLGSPTSATVTIQDIPPPFNGSYNVGTGETYTSLTNSGGIFEGINVGGASGNVTINITSNLTGETGAVALNLVAGGFTVTIQPSGAPRSITGSASSTALIRTNGANGVTIDGSVGGGGVDRSLTIENTNVTNPSVILFGSIGATPITNDTLKNCVVRNGVTTSSAVVISDAGTLGNAGFFSNITVQNNDIQKAFIGVFATGGTTPQNGSNLIYTQNTLNTAGANSIRLVGLYMQGVNGATVSDNVIGNFEAANAENDTGIWLATGTINATVSGNTISALNYTGAGAASPIGINLTPVVASSNITVSRNTISNMTSGGSSSTSLILGISITGASGGVTIERNNVQNIGNTNTQSWPAVGINLNGGNNNIVRNNFVARIYNDQTAGTGAFTPLFGVSGIRLNAGTGHQIYNNSVHMYGAMVGAVGSDLISALSIFSTTVTDCDIRNNILSNEMTGGNPSGGNTRFVGINLPPTPTVSMNLTLNNNAYYEGTDPNCRMAVVGQSVASPEFAAANFNAGSTSPATNFRSVSSTLSAAGTNDNASFASTLAPAFVSASDLHITPSAGAVLGGAAPIGSVTIDYDSDPRPAANPDIGADELVQAVGGSIPAGTYYNASAAAAGTDVLGGNVTITNTLYLNGILSTGANTLTIDCNGVVSGASPTTYIIGNLKKNYCTAGVKGFEVGTANGYSPVSVNVTAGTPNNFTVKAVQGPQPNIMSPGSALQRYWVLTATGVTADLNFNYIDADIPAPPSTENSFVIFKYDGSFTMPGGTVTPASNQASISGVSSFSDWTLAQPNAPTAGSSRISGIITREDGSPLGGVTVNLSGAGSTRTITNGNGLYSFENVETNGFYSVTPGLANFSFTPASRSFSLVGNKTDAVFTGRASTNPTDNPLETGDFFVRQQYLDFLNREPDQAGWLYWTNEIARCGNDVRCIRQRRLDVSAAFFMSEEFQRSGSYIFRLYQAGLGRTLTFAEFRDDHPHVVGGADLESQRTAFADSFVQREEFVTKYSQYTVAETFVDELLRGVQLDAGLDLSSQREALLAAYSSGGTLNDSRSAVLLAVADSTEYVSATYNRAFVQMEYFGYLRRDAEGDGYRFWLNVLNNREPGNFRGMVCSFLTSLEYQQRFSPVATHSNAECGQ